VPESERDRIFDIFHRAERGDGAPSGTGLGLAIVKGMVEAHGGSVRVTDGPSGRGACFEMTLPLAQWIPGFAMPNFYFHLSMAYAILRSRGVAVGKRDFFAGGL
jgi:hypothetical protein